MFKMIMLCGSGSDQLNPILKAFGHEEKTAKNVLIIGGGNIFTSSKNVRGKF